MTTVMIVKIVICSVLMFLLGMICMFCIMELKFSKDKPIDKNVIGGFLIIHKNDEAIDGQIKFTKDLWRLSLYKQATFKIIIEPGEPGDWERKK